MKIKLFFIIVSGLFINCMVFISERENINNLERIFSETEKIVIKGNFCDKSNKVFIISNEITDTNTIELINKLICKTKYDQSLRHLEFRNALLATSLGAKITLHTENYGKYSLWILSTDIFFLNPITIYKSKSDLMLIMCEIIKNHESK